MWDFGGLVKRVNRAMKAQNRVVTKVLIGSGGRTDYDEWARHTMKTIATYPRRQDAPSVAECPTLPSEIMGIPVIESKSGPPVRFEIADHHLVGFPCDVCDEQIETHHPWTLLEDGEGNQWRAHVLCAPVLQLDEREDHD